jgi:hypothetical protein
MHGGGLHKRSVHLLHGLATILSVMPMRRALRGIATFHHLFRRRRSTAIECIPRKSDCEHRQKNWLGQTHH